MTTTSRRYRARLRAVPTDLEGASAIDDIKIARQRMRHLAPWNVEPLPVMHFAGAATAAEPVSDEVRARGRRLALQVLAVQMWHTSARSALQ